MEKKVRFKDSGLAYLLCYILIIGVSIVMASVISSVANVEGSEVSEVANREWISYLNAFLSELIFVISFLIIVVINKNKNFSNDYRLKFKFDYKIFLSVIFFAIFVMFCCLNLTNVINIAFSNISYLPLSNEIGLGLNSFWEYLIAVFLLAVLPGVCEELFFRGLIYNSLRQRFSFKISLVLTTLMFVLIHASIYKTFYQAILGVILALLIFYTGTIFYGVIFHFVNNFIILTISYAFKGNKIFEFTVWGVKEVLISILIFLIGAVVVVLFFTFLKKYTNEHKNYFNLEKDESPIETFESIANSSTYEVKFKNNNKRSEGMVLFLISVVFALLMWSFNSFGGFILWIKKVRLFIMH